MNIPAYISLPIVFLIPDNKDIQARIFSSFSASLTAPFTPSCFLVRAKYRISSPESAHTKTYAFFLSVYVYIGTVCIHYS